ncbi:hypothetical protein GCM10009801_38660 [Streptomyces albiaxialis]|uniref:DUF202 domain-containing protein n=1 Tax=Streptomyces albiaxialis TaxID=329523 RepID=A0ABN2W1B5_9ACTN
MTTPPETEGPARPLRDPGAQPERTRLAWRRTTLTYVVSVGLALRTVVAGDTGALALTGVALAALSWLAFLAVAHRRIQELGTRETPRALRVGEMRATLACVLLLVAVGVMLL